MFYVKFFSRGRSKSCVSASHRTIMTVCVMLRRRRIAILLSSLKRDTSYKVIYAHVPSLFWATCTLFKADVHRRHQYNEGIHKSQRQSRSKSLRH